MPKSRSLKKKNITVVVTTEGGKKKLIRGTVKQDSRDKTELNAKWQERIRQLLKRCGHGADEVEAIQDDLVIRSTDEGFVHSRISMDVPCSDGKKGVQKKKGSEKPGRDKSQKNKPQKAGENGSWRTTTSGQADISISGEENAGELGTR